MKKVFSRLNALKAGRSCAEFASFCGLPQQTMYNYCSEIRPPNLEAILKICTTNRISADWLLGLSDDRGGSAPSAEAQEATQKISALEKENEALRGEIKGLQFALEAAMKGAQAVPDSTSRSHPA